MLCMELPEDMIGEIYKYIPITTLYTLNKQLFTRYYQIITDNYTVNSTVFQNYMRHLIRRDCNFQMIYLLRYNFLKWNKPLSWKYKQNTFPSYIIFLRLLCNHHNSQKCKNLITEYLERSLSNKKRHKKIRSKNTKWSN